MSFVRVLLPLRPKHKYHRRLNPFTILRYTDIGPRPLTICADDWSIAPEGSRSFYFLALFVVAYLLPVVIICSLSCAMIRQLWTVEVPTDAAPVTCSSRQRAPLSSSSGSDRARIRRKVTRLVVVVCAVFAVCWAPSHVVWLWSNAAGESTSWPRTYAFYYFRIAAHALSYGNSAMNPVIYAFLSANFRKGFQRAIYCRDGGRDGNAGAGGGRGRGRGSAPRSAATMNHHVTLTSTTATTTTGRRSLVCVGKSFSQDTNVNSSYL